MVKLVFSWNIKPNEEMAYSEFVNQEFAPKIMRLGIRLTEAWLTVYGEGPQIIMPGIAADHESLQKVLSSKEWRELEERLKTLVTDYRVRILTG
ncbi:MAG: hypothetical protein RMM31_02015 [Anaerolineae bacterium]|nr:hypothetical protein [Thermoflexales bacterium]MDW8394998.1 hypothetical protein [Anaerolineae bacterium]